MLAELGDREADLEVARQKLNSGALKWHNFLICNDILLRCEGLKYFSFWITPEALPKRYSTRFFLAAMPEGQDALHCGGELTESCWMTAGQALDAERCGELSMHFPTIKTLESLQAHQTVDALLSWAEACGESGVPCIFPTIGKRDGERHVIVEGRDAGLLK